MRTFDELVTEAVSAPITGWDFSWLAARSSVARLPWSYRRIVGERAADADTMLDMGTGGGEQLSEISPRSRHTVATEAWEPNVPVAAARLRPLGIPVVWDEGSPDNTVKASEDRGRMPFRTSAFALVINRHEAFRANEVARVLAPGGTFITQQVDFHSYDGLYDLLGLDMPKQPESWLPVACRQVGDAGMTLQQGVRGEERIQFHDVAAVIYYLRVVAWAVPEFSLETRLAQLRVAHDNTAGWPLTLRLRRFLLVATKQSATG